MQFPHGEPIKAIVVEPQPLGAEIDLEGAMLYDAFADGRSHAELYAVWMDPAVTNPTIRQRIVTVLSAPRGYDLPYPHPDESIDRTLRMSENTNGQVTNLLRQRLANRPELAEELARGILYWLGDSSRSVVDRTHDSNYEYMSAIQQLLPLVSEDTADALFGHYPINDREPYQTMDDSTGYRPLAYLISDRDIPEKYIETVLARWFEIIENEQAGISSPRMAHEQAIRKMSEFVENWTYGYTVDDGIHTAIIAFLEGHTPAGETYVRGFNATQVAEHITDEDTRFDFALRHVLIGPQDEWGRFVVDSPKDVAFVAWIREQAQLRELSQFDTILEGLMEAYEARRQSHLARLASEAALRERLRS